MVILIMINNNNTNACRNGNNNNDIFATTKKLSVAKYYPNVTNSYVQSNNTCVANAQTKLVGTDGHAVDMQWTCGGHTVRTFKFVI